jgi:hypothetical protein
MFEAFIFLCIVFEEYKYRLREAVVEGDAALVKEMLATNSWSNRGLNICLADCRYVHIIIVKRA